MSIECEYPIPFVAKVTINNPARRNALGEAEFRALAKLWPTLNADTDIRVIVLCGAGDLAFCAGADLGAGLEHLADINDTVNNALLKTAVFSKPIIAAINGHCVAGGLELVLSTDIRIAASSARFGFPEVKWGIIPSGGGALKLAAQIGHLRAMEMLLGAELKSALWAKEIGLVSEVVDGADAALKRAMAVAERLAGYAPCALQATKRLAAESTRAEVLRLGSLEADVLALVRTTDERAIGTAAFLSKTAPQYMTPPRFLAPQHEKTCGR